MERREALQPTIGKLAELPVPDADVVAVTKISRPEQRGHCGYLIGVRMEHVDRAFRIDAAKVGLLSVKGLGAMPIHASSLGVSLSQEAG
jgi:hypothetical protein